MTNSQSPIKHTLPPRPPSDPKISQRARRQKTSSRESLVSSHSHDIESTVIDKPKRSLNDHDSNNSSSDSLGSWERKDKMEPLRALKKNTSQNSLPPLPKLEIQTSFTSRQPPPNFSPKPAPKHFRSEGHLRSESQSSLGGKSTIGLKSSLSTPRTPPPPSRSPAPPSSRSMSNINTDFKPAPPSFSPAPSPHTRSGSYSFGKSTNFIDSNNHFRSKSANSPKKSNLKIDIHSKITDLPMTTSPTTYESPYSSPQSPMRSPRLQSKKKLGKKDSHLQSQSLGYASSISQLNDSQDESKALEKARRRLKKNLVKREESLSPKRSNTPEVQLEPLKNDTEDENELNAQQEEIKEEDVVLNDENEPTAADLLFKKFNKRVIDFVNDIMCVTIHSADALRPSLKILHPIIMVHIIDSITGKYISKTDPTRPVTTFYETDNLDHILPQLTRPYSFAKNLTITPKWEQDLVFNDEYLHILKDNVIVFFELLDFATGSKNQHFQQAGGWHHIAWAFLKLVGGNNQANTESKSRLQLYHYPKNGVSNANKDAPFVYNCWKQKRQPYPSSLYVTVKAIRSVEERDVSRRAVLPTEVEVGKQTYEELMDEYLNRKKTVDPLMKNLINVPTKPVWRRLAGQKCIIPNKIMYKIDSGSGGSQCIAFSNNGVYLAIASISNLNVASGKNSGSNAQNSSYIIKIYTVQTGERVANLEGHQDLIYELNWSHNDRYLSSSSSDGSVRVWTFSIDGSIRSTSIYQHPSYVYTTAFHPTSKSPQVLASGCFDGKIRIWIQDLHNKLQDYKRDTPFLVLTGHESQVNSLCFATDGNRMYSGDSNGVLKIWATDIPHESSKPLTDHIGDFRCLKSISTETNSIMSIRMHPSNRKILVNFQNGQLKTLDTRIFRWLTSFELPTETLENKRSDIASKQADILGSSISRSSFSPCGSFVFNGNRNGKVFVWKCDTGDFVSFYGGSKDRTGVQKQISEVVFHPHDHIIAFCSFGDDQPVVVYTFDKDLLSNNMNTKEVEESKIVEERILERKSDIKSIADLLATSIRDLSTSLGNYPVDDASPKKFLQTPKHERKNKRVDIDQVWTGVGREVNI